MAEKRRGLGRGLSALIPETQTEPGGRPSDVFFPGSAASGQSRTEPSPEGESRSEDIAAALLAPSRRRKSGRSAGGRTSASVRRATQAGEDVSRETSAPTARTSTASIAPSPARRGSAADRDEEAAGIAARRAGEASATTRDGVPEVPDREVDPADVARNVHSEDDADSAVEESDELVPVPGTTFGELSIDSIVANRRQPRQVFDKDDISELADSIKEVGLLQPVVVRRIEGDNVDAAVSTDGAVGADATVPRYELVMGERRLRAAREAGLVTVPALVRRTEDEELLRDALLENLHRVQLNPLEEAAAYQQLLEDFGCTHVELSTRIARSRSQISNTLRLMKLPPLVQRRLAAGVLSAGHARALLGLPDSAAMERLAQRIVAEGLSVRATEELVALHDELTGREARVLRARSTPLPALSTRLSDAFETRVKVTRGAKKGRITIEFAGEDDLARIVGALAPGVSVAED